jgi:hypothetical protein
VSDLAALVVDSEGAVEALLELDAAAGVATAAWARWYLDEPLLKADGVVVGDGAHIVEAANGVDVGASWETLVGGLGIGGRAREAFFEAGQVAFERLVGFAEVAGVSSTQFLDQAVLQGSPASLYAALGLRRAGQDQVDAQLLQGSGDLGGLSAPCQFFA